MPCGRLGHDAGGAGGAVALIGRVLDEGDFRRSRAAGNPRHGSLDRLGLWMRRPCVIREPGLANEGLFEPGE